MWRPACRTPSLSTPGTRPRSSSPSLSWQFRCLCFSSLSHPLMLLSFTVIYILETVRTSVYSQEKEILKFHEKCRLQCLFPEQERQTRRQAERLRLGCYFPDQDQRAARRQHQQFRESCMLRCFFPELDRTRRGNRFSSSPTRQVGFSFFAIKY